MRSCVPRAYKAYVYAFDQTDFEKFWTERPFSKNCFKKSVFKDIHHFFRNGQKSKSPDTFFLLTS